MKRTLIALLLCVLLYSSVSTTSALYQKSFQIKSGDIVMAPTPTPPPVVNNALVRVKEYLSMESARITGDVEVSNGPIYLRVDGQNTIQGNLKLNNWVSLSGTSVVQGKIERTKVTYPEITYDMSKVPTNLPLKDHLSINRATTINQSGYYHNANISATVTFDASKQDIYLIVNNMNLSGDIKIVGSHKVVIIVKQVINMNGGRHINSNGNYEQLDMVLNTGHLNIQNSTTIHANVYYEGSSLNLYDNATIRGALYAKNAYIELRRAKIQGPVVCHTLQIREGSVIEGIK